MSTYVGFRLAFTLVAGFLFIVTASLDAQAHSPVTLGQSVSPAAKQIPNAKPAPPEMAMRIRVILALHNREQLDQLIGNLENKASPQYRHWLTTGQFNAQFGPAASDASAVSTWER